MSFLGSLRNAARTAYKQQCRGRNVIVVNMNNNSQPITRMTPSCCRRGLSTLAASADVEPPPGNRSDLLSSHANVTGPFGSYLDEYDLSLKDPEQYWKKAAEKVEWFQKPNTILDYDPQDNPYFPKWYPDGLVNMAYNCLDVHVDKYGRGEQDALIYDSPVTGTKERFTYQELLDQVSTLAGAMKDLGVEPGDRVVLYMPMIPQAVIAMLACCRIGAIHSVVFGGFAAKELATRITDCKPKMIITASKGVEPSHIVYYKPLLDKALELADHDVQHTIVVQRRNVPNAELASMGPLDLDYDELMAKSKPIDAVPLPSNHVHSILYTSGTTGLPKGVVRDTGGYAVNLKHSMGSFYNLKPGECMWAASDIGWIVGHSYIVYGPLLNGSTTILYEGKPVNTPDAGAFWRVMEEYQVKTFFTAPTAIRAIKQADPNAEFAEKYDLSNLQTVFLAGEHCDPATLQYCEKALGKYGRVAEAVDHWWQTELGGPAVGNPIGLGRMPIKYGGCTAAVPGYDVHILDESGHEVATNQLGDMVLKMPLPPGTLTTLYNHDDRYIKSYLSHHHGFYDTMDAAFRDEDGYIHIVGRMDDVINVAGHRLSTGSMEECLMDHPDVAECAVFPMKDDLRGELPVGLVVLSKGSTIEEGQLRKELVALVREELGPVASFKKVTSVKSLPKTRSGKILRGTMSKIANGEEYKITPTIEDPNIFDYLGPVIQELVQK